jgi:DNA mismatch endonuclease (patch repair protein)
MRRNPRRDTRPERLLRSALHRAGLRFRVDYRVTLPGGAVRPDVVFTRVRVAVFIDGCFWHGCPEHGNVPARNTDYWVPKLNQTIARDQRNTEALQADGWMVIRAWEHAPVDVVTEEVKAAVTARSMARSPRDSDASGPGHPSAPSMPTRRERSR